MIGCLILMLEIESNFRLIKKLNIVFVKWMEFVIVCEGL